MNSKTFLAIATAIALPLAANAADSTTTHEAKRAAHHEIVAQNHAEHDSMKAAHKQQRAELRTQIKGTSSDSARKELKGQMKDLKASQKADKKALHEQQKAERKAAKEARKDAHAK